MQISVLSNLDSSGGDSYVKVNEEDLDKHQILTSTPIKVIPGVRDESVAPDSPTSPEFSPVSLSSYEVDDDKQRQEEESTIIEPEQEFTFNLQSSKILQQPCEEADLEPQSQFCIGVNLLWTT